MKHRTGVTVKNVIVLLASNKNNNNIRHILPLIVILPRYNKRGQTPPTRTHIFIFKFS